MSKNIYLSLIVPFYNEAKNLPLLHNEIVSILKKIGKKSEVVYVDDGSTDNSAEVLSRFVRLRILRKDLKKMHYECCVPFVLLSN